VLVIITVAILNEFISFTVAESIFPSATC
jgi:hypothetical protein